LHPFEPQPNFTAKQATSPARTKPPYSEPQLVAQDGNLGGAQAQQGGEGQAEPGGAQAQQGGDDQAEQDKLHHQLAGEGQLRRSSSRSSRSNHKVVL
jgi:hypothetical protein